MIANRSASGRNSAASPHFNDSPMREAARRMRSALRDLNAFVFPRNCAACENRPFADGFFCEACSRRVAHADPVVPTRLCPLFAPGLASLRCLWYTEPGSPVRAAIHAVKYGHCPELAAWLGHRAASLVSEAELLDAVVPLPIHRSRHLERGFNQAEQLSVGVSERLALPILLGLRRTVASASQTRKTSGTRRLLAPETFRAAEDVTGLRVLLVDDVVTTGTTLNTAARALLEAGAASVDGLAVAVSRRPGAP